MQLVRGVAVFVALVVLFFTGAGIAAFHVFYDPRLHREVMMVPGAVRAQLAVEHASSTPIVQISPEAQHAVVAVEDRRFYGEHGIDVLALMRALQANLQAQDPIAGGATISEQVIKRAVFHSDSTLVRKAEILAWSWELADRYSKPQILEMYLNSAYYGRGSYGIAAASWNYFHLRPNHLGIAQAAFLATLIHRPSEYGAHPFASPAQGRWKTVLADMADQGYITEEEVLIAERQGLSLMP